LGLTCVPPLATYHLLFAICNLPFASAGPPQQSKDVSMSLLGIDVGITGCKAVAFSASGDVLAQAYQEYPLYQPQPGWMELDPAEVWQAVGHVIGQAASATPRDPISALSVATHGESVVPLGSDDRPLRRFITAIDTRAEEQARWWERHLGREYLFRLTGVPLHPMYTVNKLMWLRQHEPTTFAAASTFVCMQDYVFHRLGLPPTMDYSLATRTMAFDIGHLRWSEEILELANLNVAQLSEVQPSGTVIGPIADSIAGELGLRPGVVAVTGGHDQPSGALGCGAIGEGVAMDSTGTVECVGLASPRLVLDEQLMRNNLPVEPHTVSGMYMVLGYTTAGGALLRWYRDQFARAEVQEAQRTGQDVYDLILAQATREPSPVLILPHFVGSGTPWLDAASKGAIVGLALSTTRGQILKGILDSVTYEIKLSVDAMEAAGIEVRELRAFGGGAKSPLWLQTKADIFGKPVLAMDVSEAPCLGVAILAGAATGVFKSVEEGLDQMVQVKHVYQSDEAAHRRYMEKAEVYAQLYLALAELHHRI
jgi:xylulokinase